MASRKAEKERLRQERLAREREAAAAARRRRLLRTYGTGGAALAAIVVIVAVILVSGSSSSGNGSHPSKPVLHTASIKTLGHLRPAPPAGSLGGEGIPIPVGAPVLASRASTASGNAVDGIQCNATEHALYHIHSRLTIFVDGSARQLPAGVGLTTSCLYWLHTHYPDGIIHIESPVVRTFTLGDFFDIWGQPLGPDQVGPAKGKVTAIYNGKLYVGNPRNIPLGSHTQIQLEVGKPLIAPEKVSFAGTGL